MALIKINHSKHKTAFFFEALFAAIILSGSFYLDSWLDELIDKKIHKKKKKI